MFGENEFHEYGCVEAVCTVSKKGSFSFLLFQKQKWNLFKLVADVCKGEKKVKAIITMVSLRVVDD